MISKKLIYLTALFVLLAVIGVVVFNNLNLATDTDQKNRIFENTPSPEVTIQISTTPVVIEEEVFTSSLFGLSIPKASFSFDERLGDRNSSLSVSKDDQTIATIRPYLGYGREFCDDLIGRPDFSERTELSSRSIELFGKTNQMSTCFLDGEYQGTLTYIIEFQPTSSYEQYSWEGLEIETYGEQTLKDDLKLIESIQLSN